MNWTSDGVRCAYGGGCGNSVGSVDMGGWFRYWHFIAPINYDFVRSKQNPYITSAWLVLDMPDPCGGSYGICDYTHTYVDRATGDCYSCWSASQGEAYGWLPTDGSIDVKNLYNNFLTAYPGTNQSIMVRGMEVPWRTYKMFAYDRTYIEFNYDSRPNPPTVDSTISPSDGATVVTTQPTLAVNPTSDTDGDQTQYYFTVSTGKNEAGRLATSGWQKTTSWTVPENVLDDGLTYYWHAYAWDGVGAPSEVRTSASPEQSFRVDMRNGKDATQAFDAVGALSADLSTGNITTSASSHSSSALGGALGVSFEYNTPSRSSNGLVAPIDSLDGGLGTLSRPRPPPINLV